MDAKVGFCHECQKDFEMMVYLCGKVYNDDQWLCGRCISELTFEARLARRIEESAKEGVLK